MNIYIYIYIYIHYNIYINYNNNYVDEFVQLNKYSYVILINIF